ncbi:MAG: helix-turn-helix transcriptional regulator [Hyphomicrobium sp.]
MNKAHNDLLTAVEAIYASAGSPEQWPETLDRIAQCFSAVGAVLLQQHDDGRIIAITSAGIADAAIDYANKWAAQDVRVSRGKEAGLLTPAGAYTDRDIVTPAEMETLPFYKEFLTPHGLAWFVGGNVSPHPAVLVALSVQRARQQGAFTDEEVQLFLRIAHHVEKALRISIRIADLEATHLALAEALTRFDCAVYLFDDEARVVFANSKAEELIGRVFRLAGSRLEPVLSSERARFAEGLNATKRNSMLSDAMGPILVRGPHDDLPFICHMQPLVLAEPQSLKMTNATILLLVTDAHAAAKPDPGIIRDIFGITLGEARVAALVGTGKSPRETARSLGITEETTRVVLKRVFAKVGVSRQSELAALISRLWDPGSSKK